jgi:hypothetical protein
MPGKIVSIKFKDFKRLGNFTVTAGPGNIFVGPNNSGKSSILDAFRLLDACLRHTRTVRPHLISNDLGAFDGHNIPDSVLPFHLSNSVTNYGDNGARIAFTHENGTTAYIDIDPSLSVQFFVDANGRRLQTSAKIREAFPIDLVIVPTLSPLESDEILVQPETVRRNRNTRLAARTFRNIWHLEDDAVFESFRERVERAWPGIKLQPPELVRATPPRVEMYFEEDRVTREVQWAGFGFQVWLQIHTHLIRGNRDSILVLDEPDVYLHPDLQHRLYKDVKELFGQFFLATHAIEIINVADTSEILVVEPKAKAARRIKRDSDYDAMLNYLGSVENADFAKISRVKKVLFVEGQDAKLLRGFARKIGHDVLGDEQLSPIFQLGGFSQWRRAEATIWAFKSLLSIDIEVLCLFDRDFRCADEVDAHLKGLKAVGINAFILNRKEIENYLLAPEAIAKSVQKRLTERGSPTPEYTAIDAASMISSIAADLKNITSAHITSNELRYFKEQRSSLDDSTIISRALAAFETEWSTTDGICKLAPGKELLSKLFDDIQKKHKVSISSAQIRDNMKSDEIDAVLREILVNLDQFFRND